MKYMIYQLKNIRETDYGFMSWDFAESHGFTMDDYNVVYSGTTSEDVGLDGLFEMFNLHHPADFRGHSLSVSDVVAIQNGDGLWEFYYCDSFGWQLINN